MIEIIKKLAITFGVLVGVMVIAPGLIWFERKLLALFQNRCGPNRVGPFGMFQVLADMIKIFTKEDWIPPLSDKPVFVIAPAIVVATVLMTFAVIPFAKEIYVVDLNVEGTGCNGKLCCQYSDLSSRPEGSGNYSKNYSRFDWHYYRAKG